MCTILSKNHLQSQGLLIIALMKYLEPKCTYLYLGLVNFSLLKFRRKYKTNSYLYITQATTKTIATRISEQITITSIVKRFSPIKNSESMTRGLISQESCITIGSLLLEILVWSPILILLEVNGLVLKSSCWSLQCSIHGGFGGGGRSNIGGGGPQQPPPPMPSLQWGPRWSSIIWNIKNIWVSEIVVMVELVMEN